MDQVELMNEIESVKDLLGDPLESWDVKVMLFLDFAIVLAVFVEVVSKQLSYDKKMLLMIEVIIDLK